MGRTVAVLGVVAQVGVRGGSEHTQDGCCLDVEAF